MERLGLDMKKSKRLNRLGMGLCGVVMLASGCTTEIDEDAFRAGAIQVELNEVTSDELYPTAGDEIDWKMVFVPTPGDFKVVTWWDDPTGIFNVTVGVYDRFGIPINVVKRDTAAGTGEVTAFTPESGLHYVKVAAESGHSIYSINIQFETNYDGFQALEEAPSYTAYADFETEISEHAKSRKKGASISNVYAGTASGGNAGTVSYTTRVESGARGEDKASSDGDQGAKETPSAPAGAVALPTAAAGGAVLPSAAVGGIAASNGQSGPTVVKESRGSGYSASEVRTLNTKSGAVSNERSAIKPIVADLKGRYKKLEAEVLSVTSKKSGASFKINVGHKDGVREGAVGEIYVDGQILEGGRFRFDKILETSSMVTTNASGKDVKKASRIVVKIPE